jgi:hypothetical protein
MYLYAPVVILHQDNKASHGVPIPIAIKLSKGEEQIITPGGDKSEEKWGWTLAKVKILNRSICRLANQGEEPGYQPIGERRQGKWGWTNVVNGVLNCPLM